MIFVYFKDGHRIDVPDAVSVIHRSQVVFLDREGEIVRQLPTDDILAYSHALYGDDGVQVVPDEPTGERTFWTLSDGEALITPRRRHRRTSKRAAAAAPEQAPPPKG